MIYSYDQLVQLWEGQAPLGTPAARPGVAENMATIALKAESNGNQYAKNYNPPTATSPASWDYGLWQVNSSHGFDANRLLNDPAYNAAAAVQVFNGSVAHGGNGYDKWTDPVSRAIQNDSGTWSGTSGSWTSATPATNASGGILPVMNLPVGRTLAIILGLLLIAMIFLVGKPVKQAIQQGVDNVSS